MLYQTEPHSDFGGRLIEEGLVARKAAFAPIATRSKWAACGVTSKVTSAALHRRVSYAISTPPRGDPSRPFLLGNGVMVTQRFLVPSF